MLKKINWFDVYLVLSIFALVGLFVFAQSRSKQRTVDAIEVKFLSNNNHFITQEMVNNLLIQNFPNATNVFKDELDLNKLEQELQKNEMIASSQVYFDANGVLNAEVVQKTAIARVLTENGSYYIDKQGGKMPLSNHFSAHVPVVLGKVSDRNRSEFIRMLNVIFEDDFLKKSITGIKINPDQSLNLTVREYDYNLEFGRLTEVEKKFNNYKAFLHYSKNDTIVPYYKNVNLRFTEQVICTK
ncbi:cell division protein FtsQ/DivIB [Flavobacterium sp. I3-2]|uniref:cell division protein FtsQ/DivIB n=1 Tax=Flavobacterium sp. I3-2 TaxID=2748319 RepID=UPI0015AF5283|nr:cell division protein FtsQ [Flavobacterium sp. I3-2]